MSSEDHSARIASLEARLEEKDRSVWREINGINKRLDQIITKVDGLIDVITKGRGIAIGISMLGAGFISLIAQYIKRGN